MVHTLGTLLESDEEKPGYKESVRGGDPFGLVRHLLANAFGGGGASGNPLAKQKMGGMSRMGSYDALNRDTGRSCPLANITLTGLPSTTRLRGIHGLSLNCDCYHRGEAKAIRIPVCRGYISTMDSGPIHRDETGGGAGFKRNDARSLGLSSSVHSSQ